MVIFEQQNREEFSIAKCSPGWLYVAGPRLSDEEAERAQKALLDAKVPFLKDWMFEIPRRWFN